MDDLAKIYRTFAAIIVNSYTDEEMEEAFRLGEAANDDGRHLP